jgi:hypothetical protein
MAADARCVRPLQRVQLTDARTAVLIDTVVMAVPVIQQVIASDPKLPIDIGKRPP